MTKTNEMTARERKRQSAQKGKGKYSSKHVRLQEQKIKASLNNNIKQIPK